MRLYVVGIASIFVSIIGAYAAIPAGAQTLVHVLGELPAGVTNESFGYAVGAAGDLDGDGRDDVLVGAPQLTLAGGLPGEAYVLSGQGGCVVHQFLGSSPGDRFGCSVAGGRDVTGDGVPDVVIGAPQAGFGPGYADVYSGSDGALVQRLVPMASGSEFGASVALADVTGDGRADVVIGDPLFFGFGSQRGRVDVYDGDGFGLVGSLFGPADFDRFGVSVSAAGFLDGDAQEEFIVGAPQDFNTPNPGYAHVVAGSGLATLWALAPAGGALGDGFGRSVAGAGDVDGDGVHDVVVGAPFVDGVVGNAGSYWVYSGATGLELCHEVGTQAAQQLGVSVAGGLGDRNGDGGDEFVVGQNSGGAGGVIVVTFSGGVCSTLASIPGGLALAGAEAMGPVVAVTGDVTGDGIPDIAAGPVCTFCTGHVGVVSGQVLAGAESFCDPCANSAGPFHGAHISFLGSTSIAAADFTLIANDLPPQKSALFLHAAGQGLTLIGGGYLCIAPVERLNPPVTTDACGFVSRPFDPSGLVPGDRFFQLWYRDPGGPGGGAAGCPAGEDFNFSNGLRVSFTP